MDELDIIDNDNMYFLDNSYNNQRINEYFYSAKYFKNEKTESVFINEEKMHEDDNNENSELVDEKKESEQKHELLINHMPSLKSTYNSEKKETSQKEKLNINIELINYPNQSGKNGTKENIEKEKESKSFFFR